MEFKAKEFCIFDCIELLFLNGMFQNKNILKNIFCRKKVKVHVFKVPVSVASLNIHSNHKQKSEILSNIYFQTMKKRIK